MAQVQGFLREDKATFGEKTVLRLLSSNLPAHYTVYVECPVFGERKQRFPDFIVMTDYGVIVLEIKDWVNLMSANRFQVNILTKDNKQRREGNPVIKAREYAILLQKELKKVPELLNDRHSLKVAWGYAVVFPNLTSVMISRLRNVWGNEFVLGLADLQQHLIKKSFRETISTDHINPLTKKDMDFVRATINPTVLFTTADRAPVILDTVQETLVVEPIKEVEEKSKETINPEETQINFLEDTSELSKSVEAIPIDERMIRSYGIRLVRGIAGSGKSLVLTQRAKYLASQYPEWKIGVITFNDDLASVLEANLRGFGNIKTMTFHSLCSYLWRTCNVWKQPENSIGWIKNHKEDYPVINKLGSEFLANEINWLKDLGIYSREEYQITDRRGRGQQLRLQKNSDIRNQIFDVLEGNNLYLSEKSSWDWCDVPNRISQAISDGFIKPDYFEAILIDEAQDFAPSWITLIKQVLQPKIGLLFMADDPSQSIYRYFSWKEKGVSVVGRTKHLRIPYRNTYEIHTAAYELIRGDEILQRTLREEGVLLDPDFESVSMRHGPRPLMKKFNNFNEEVIYIRDEVNRLFQNGYKPKQIAVLHRRKKGISKLKNELSKLEINIDTMHAYKGLEFEVIFLSQMHETFQSENENELSDESRLVYMAMTRARQQLNMGYQGKLPNHLNRLQNVVDFIN